MEKYSYLAASRRNPKLENRLPLRGEQCFRFCLSPTAAIYDFFRIYGIFVIPNLFRNLTDITEDILKFYKSKSLTISDAEINSAYACVKARYRLKP